MGRSVQRRRGRDVSRAKGRGRGSSARVDFLKLLASRYCTGRSTRSFLALSARATYVLLAEARTALHAPGALSRRRSSSERADFRPARFRSTSTSARLSLERASAPRASVALHLVHASWVRIAEEDLRAPRRNWTRRAGADPLRSRRIPWASQRDRARTYSSAQRGTRLEGAPWDGGERAAGRAAGERGEKLVATRARWPPAAKQACPSAVSASQGSVGSAPDARRAVQRGIVPGRLHFREPSPMQSGAFDPCSLVRPPSVLAICSPPVREEVRGSKGDRAGTQAQENQLAGREAQKGSGRAPSRCAFAARPRRAQNGRSRSRSRRVERERAASPRASARA